MEEDSFFDTLSNFQRKRMDEQRCSLRPKSFKKGDEPTKADVPQKLLLHRSSSLPNVHVGTHGEDSQSVCLSEQRTNLPAVSAAGSDEDFFCLIRQIQSKRLDEQRCTPPTTVKKWHGAKPCTK
ncbi:G-protein-signaling modulator 2-like isoform X2 [Amphiura filiformis]|uniref:G-protein-signaling modulator 2-like isoform X2 n=1 Tax=Amphiura filiformis TaxID=82378 RepID=UPI003B21ACD7